MASAASFPLFSIIVPINDQNVHLLSFTLDSIAQQGLDSYEVIIIDGQSKEHSLTIFEAYQPRLARIYTALDRNFSAMLNKGVDLASGRYLHFLQPGEFYLSRNAFRFLKEFIDLNSTPDLIYTGCILRHSQALPQQFFKPITIEDLKGVKIPLGLQAYWFRKETILRLGKFDTRYRIQSGFDMVCRLYCHPELRKVFMRRILTDYEYRLAKPTWIMRQLFETLVIIFRQFGFSKAVFFWIANNQFRLIRWWSKNIKSAFWKRRPI